MALDEELQGDVAPGGPQGAAQPDLAGALDDRHQRHVGDADGADQQRHAAE
jgi:hypothetical protein